MQAQKRPHLRIANPPRIVQLPSMLLFIQAVLLIYLGGLNFSWMSATAGASPSLYSINLTFGLRSVAFWGLALVGLLTSIGFLQVKPLAWVSAVVLEGLCLLLMLNLYFQSKPAYAYPGLLYSLIMVFYLHYSAIREVFQRKQIAKLWGGIDDLGR